MLLSFFFRNKILFNIYVQLRNTKSKIIFSCHYLYSSIIWNTHIFMLSTRYNNINRSLKYLKSLKINEWIYILCKVKGTLQTDARKLASSFCDERFCFWEFYLLKYSNQFANNSCLHIYDCSFITLLTECKRGV